uniref:Uncharacterized protein n=1 Tax=Glossina pallidipes TaxID=7398 RepID=A0A1A9ZB51_GLOPL
MILVSLQLRATISYKNKTDFLFPCITATSFNEGISQAYLLYREILFFLCGYILEIEKQKKPTITERKNSKTTSITKKLFYYSIKNTTTTTTTKTTTYNTYLEKSKSLQRENKRRKKKLENII